MPQQAVPVKESGNTCCICILKLVFSPCILLAQAIWIYIFGCCFVYIERLGRGIFCGVCVCCNCTHKDKQFPADDSSIGQWADRPPGKIDWYRIGVVCATSGKRGAKLFSGGIEPGDICQGQLGDCWLLSAIASLSSHTGTIQSTFITREYNAYGKYKVKLYDKPTEKWVTVVIDDWIPCKGGTNKPMFAQPNGDEAWVLLLEKAMAKFKGSYAALDGGSSLWALECLTGDIVFKFQWNKADLKWKRYDLVHIPKAGVKVGGRAQYDMAIRDCQDPLTSDEMFQSLLFYMRKGSVVGASTGPGSDKENVNGIVQGHAYTLMNVKEVDGFKMVRLRNPWGTFEWKGAWSDFSPLWDQYPKIAKALKFKDASKKDDGTFWMEWKDFLAYYQNLDVCCRTTGWDDLQLDIHEVHPIAGPCIGCTIGCATFWLCCRGCKALLCARKSSPFEKPPQGCMAQCMP